MEGIGGITVLAFIGATLALFGLGGMLYGRAMHNTAEERKFLRAGMFLKKQGNRTMVISIIFFIIWLLTKK